MQKTAVLFDFDNTLVDFLTAETEAEAELAKRIEKKFRVPAREFLARFNWIKPRRIHKDSRSEEFSRILWVSEALAWLHVEPDYDAINDLVNEYWKAAMKKTRLFPKTKEVLEEVKKTRKIGIVSDCDGNVVIKNERLRRAGILDYFDVVVTTDLTGFNKPHIENFRLACDKLGVRPGMCVMVGDSPVRDLISPKKLGMVTVWNKQRVVSSVSYPYIDYELKDIGELPSLLRRIDSPR